MIRLISVFCAAGIVAASLSACGQKGPLVPADSPKKLSANSASAK